MNIPWSQPEINDEELNQIIDSFNADWLTMGPKVKEFEKYMADYLHVPHAVAVTNGTLALDLSLKILGVRPGDEVIVPAMTYFATAAAVSYQFAVPVFVDIESNSYNLDCERIEEAISPKTKAIIFIDYGGNPADIEGLRTIAKKHGLILFQDAAQSLGGIYQGSPLGAQTEISITSFHIAKVMTTVEGGMILTHKEEFAIEARIRRNQGESGKYLHSHLGTNARMTDISAAIGLGQVKKLKRLLKERERVASLYNDYFEKNNNIGLTKCKRFNSKHGNFFYPILVKNRDRLADYLKSKGVDTRIAYPMPVYEQELYRCGRALFRKTPCPISESFTADVINLPIYPSLSDEQIDFIANEVVRFVEQ